ncbi:NADPH:quinone reductase-like Zn-dependent oxidoreductase [Leifsonia sp. AK011]|uniref:zinc-binding alcohol dehydrogenase family protein n=1 Tax=Leifsonia sp. AK011 TaxID=2723075 RepID=UPI0015C96492|nr:zinc-binding alcohol dehydrogenase family protein [Leifsonia sp. AK011]NYF09049.1 NADPH:quinone reductase-like Zn-dependent oxidoreductase [Leifsonia sp. AK011]
MTIQNSALWLSSRAGELTLAPAPYTPPASGQVVVRTRAVAINPLDAIGAFIYRVAFPWVRFPAIIGTDVAGEIVEVGAGVTRLAPGDRVIGYAVGLEKSRNNPAEGAFQHYVVLLEHLVSPIPDAVTFEEASVLPLTLATAAVGLYQKDQLGLPLPTIGPIDRAQTVLVWGGSTSLGSNAIQLARSSGYRVVATASPRNVDYVRSLGAEAVIDYRSVNAVDELVTAIGNSPLTGTIAIGDGSLRPSIRVASRTQGSRRVASAMVGPLISLQALRARMSGVHVSTIWGGSLKDNEVGPAIFADFLPNALATAQYRPAPVADVVGTGLEAIPGAIQKLKGGVSASKLVVTI